MVMFFHNVDDQYLSSKDANSLLFNSFNENSNFSILYLNIRSLSNLKNFSKLEGCHRVCLGILRDQLNWVTQIPALK